MECVTSDTMAVASHRSTQKVNYQNKKNAIAISGPMLGPASRATQPHSDGTTDNKKTNLVSMSVNPRARTLPKLSPKNERMIAPYAAD